MRKCTERLLADEMALFRSFLEMHTNHVNFSYHNNRHCGLSESFFFFFNGPAMILMKAD